MRVSIAILALAACGPARGPSSVTPTVDRFPGLAAITEAELRADLFTLAGDGFRGREAGTLDELRASAWLAERARAIGLEPAGDDGTYFQLWPMRRLRPSSASRVSVDGSGLAFGIDVVPVGLLRAMVDAPLVFVGAGREADVQGLDLNGKSVAAVISPPANPPAAGMSLRPWRYARAAIAERAAFLQSRGAAAVLMISDQTADSGWAFGATGAMRGTYGIDSAGPPVIRQGVPVLWIRASAREKIPAAGGRLTVDLQVESFLYPSVNVVARVPGRDPGLRDQYVLFSGHQDHDGVRTPVAGDSIYNGADDNASVSVALLAIGRAFVRQPGRRSALFVWHGAEERGLLGSRWHARNPVVPRDRIAAVLNADMIGHNHPDSAAFLGVQPPHRNSSDLARMGLEANARVSRFQLDTLWDRPTHPEGWYFRSDHLPYARLGIPAVYFSTLPHPLYHTPEDEPERIDLVKLAGVTRWMYATGWLVAEANERPKLDPGFKLER